MSPLQKQSPAVQRLLRHCVDNKIDLNQLNGAKSEQVREALNASPASSFDGPSLETFPKELFAEAKRVLEKEYPNALMFGGSSAVNSPAFARFSAPNEGKTVGALASGNGEHPSFERLGELLDRGVMLMTSRQAPLSEVVRQKAALKEILDLVGSDLPVRGDAMGDKMMDVSKTAADGVRQAFTSEKAYQSIYGGDAKNAPKFTALQNAIFELAMNAKLLDVPVAALLKRPAGRQVFANFAAQNIGAAEPSEEQRDAFLRSMKGAIPLEDRPMQMARVELGAAKLTTALESDDLVAAKAVLTSKEGLQQLGAQRQLRALVDQGDLPPDHALVAHLADA